MPSRHPLWLLLAVALAGAQPEALLAQVESPLIPPDIASAVRELGSANFAAREKASKLLWSRGQDSETALLLAGKSADREIARRAGEVLAKFRRGIYPDTPPQVLAGIEIYERTTLDNKAALLTEMLRNGTPAFRTIHKLLAAETTKERLTLWGNLKRGIEPLRLQMVHERRFAELEALLEIGLAGGEERALADYATFLFLAGRQQARLERWRALAELAEDPHAWLVLAWLHRISGDLPQAERAAEKCDQPEILFSILHDQAKWHELSLDHKRFAEMQTNLPLRAAVHHLAGHEEPFRRLASEIGVDALLHFGEVAKAWSMLEKEPDFYWLDLLATRWEYARVFQVLDQMKASAPGKEVYRARQLIEVGEKQKAAEALRRAHKESDKLETQAAILQVEAKLTSLAELLPKFAQLLDKALKVKWNEKSEKGPGEAWQEAARSVLEGAFPEKSHEALGWWLLFGKVYPQDGTQRRLERIAAHLTKRTSAQELEAIFAEVLGLGDDPLFAERMFSFADSARAYGRMDLAEKCLAAAFVPRSEVLRRLGDLHAEQKSWDKAVASYGQARKLSSGDSVLCFLEGWALMQQGQTSAGRALIETARWLPLGDPYARWELASAMNKAGLVEDARREKELLLRCGSDWAVGETYRELSRAAEARKDYAQAARFFEKAVVQFFRSGSVYLQNEAPLWVGYRLCDLRARDFLAAGKIDLALKEARLCVVLFPSDADIPIRFVPELKRLGREKEAVELFQPVFASLQRLCRDYPSSGQFHNALAWQCGRCRMELDAGLVHARSAVALEPARPDFLHTLAEVHFQRGEADQALKQIQECIRLAPADRFYQAELKRIKAGDPSAPAE